MPCDRCGSSDHNVSKCTWPIGHRKVTISVIGEADERPLDLVDLLLTDARLDADGQVGGSPSSFAPLTDG